MTEIQKFDFNSENVRFVGDMPVGVDVARSLGYLDAKSAVKTNVSKKNKVWVGKLPPLGIGKITGNRINGGYVLKEAGIYQLIFKSKLPSAEEFQDWVFEEVLPSIRNSGQYSIKKQLSREEIIDMCCLPVPAKWSRRFPEEYYEQLQRLTGLKQKGHKRPVRWAQLTQKLVYGYLPDGLYDRVKQCKAQTGSYDKLHQFLSEEGLIALEEHQRRLLTYMEASSTVKELESLLIKARTKQYQLPLF